MDAPAVRCSHYQGAVSDVDNHRRHAPDLHLEVQVHASARTRSMVNGNRGR